MGYGRPSGCNMRPLTFRHLAAAIFTFLSVQGVGRYVGNHWDGVAAICSDFGAGCYVGARTLLARHAELPTPAGIWHNLGVVVGSLAVGVLWLFVVLACIDCNRDAWRWATRKRDPVKPPQPPTRGSWPP